MHLFRVFFDEPVGFVFWKDLSAPSSAVAALLAKAEREAQGLNAAINRVEVLQ